MAQGITLRLQTDAAEFPAPLLRQIAWVIKCNAEVAFPGLGDLTVEVFDTTDFDFGRNITGISPD